MNENELRDYFEELNQMSLELALWVPDSKLLNDIMLRLQNNPDAKGIRQIVGDVRKLILENSQDDFDNQQITLWPK